MENNKKFNISVEAEKAAKEIFSRLNAITTVYHLEFVRKDNGKNKEFAAFYGKTFPYEGDMCNDDIIAESKRQDADILAMLDLLKDYIGDYVGEDDFISGLHKNIHFVQFHGDDNKRRSMHDNVVYCQDAEQAFENFKHFYELAKRPESAADGTVAEEDYLTLDLFKGLRRN